MANSAGAPTPKGLHQGHDMMEPLRGKRSGGPVVPGCAAATLGCEIEPLRDTKHCGRSQNVRPIAAPGAACKCIFFAVRMKTAVLCTKTLALRGELDQRVQSLNFDRGRVSRWRDLEGMAYGIPCYKKSGTIEVAFASQKNYIALYVLKKDVVDAFRAEPAGANIGKGSIRYSRPEQLDFKSSRSSRSRPALRRRRMLTIR